LRLSRRILKGRVGDVSSWAEDLYLMAIAEQVLQSTRAELREAKAACAKAIAQRSASQREVNELLHRKSSWAPQDLERFTALYRSDHANEQAESSAQEAVSALEKRAEETSATLSACILARYHEEQIWSDKIRRMSTWGTWGLMGVNVLLFLVFQIGIEPWRRKRLVQGFEDKVIEALEREAAASPAVGDVMPDAALQSDLVRELGDGTAAASSGPATASQEVVAAVELAEADGARYGSGEPLQTMVSAAGVKPPWLSLRALRQSLGERFSQQQIVVRKVDLTAATLEGTFYGIMLASIVAALIRGK
jgi:sensitive to high expression protein 9, mitochondrial